MKVLAEITKSPYSENTRIVWAPDVPTLSDRGSIWDLDWDKKYDQAFVEATNKLFTQDREGVAL